jgi:lipopolysaccharide transport system ATP-binding protein
MSDIAIKVQDVGKLYRLGEVGTGTLSQDLKRWWAVTRGKEDPFAKIGELNDRTTKGDTNFVWALKDVSFEVKQGEVLGIIGRNGAGKSTLLKLLSKVTQPTTGNIKIKGRIASLLEVGTGFHPDLTGRENIYLNGAILGMTKREIKSKFDEIVDFAGVERYIDTPVKRYSSGMYVRLAFAVAAFLEPEILIIDEVLAVGDAEFQKKCLGRMKDVSVNDGRTVLFVSHNMTAIKNLCNTVLYMQYGSVWEYGPTAATINTYLSHNINSSLRQVFLEPAQAPGNDLVKLKRIEVCPVQKNNSDPILVHTDIDIEFEFWNYVEGKEINLTLHLYTIAQECIFSVGSPAQYLKSGIRKGVCRIPGNLLNDGIYTVSMMVVAERSYAVFNFENAVSFEVNENRDASGWHGKWPGFIRPVLDFKLES